MNDNRVPAVTFDPRPQDLIDFRDATGLDVLAWYQRQASRMDEALEHARSDSDRLACVLDFLTLTSGLVGETYRRIGAERVRPERDEFASERFAVSSPPPWQ